MRVLFITLFVVIADQVTKLLIKGIKIPSLGINLPGMPYGSSKPLIGDFVKITFIENPGMAFGIDVGPKMFLTIFTIAASLFIFYYIFKHRKDGILIRLSLALILAGAIGNLIDRTFYGVIFNYAPLFNGKVVDFMQVEFWDFTIMGRTYTTWPIWNIADASVSAGFLIILFFHNRIFKTNEGDSIVNSDGSLVSQNVEGELNAETSEIVTGDNLNTSNQTLFTPNNNAAQNNVTENFNSLNNTSSLNGKSKIEDTEENGSSGPGGTIEDKN
ncbi:MAG: signal peptidase II [Ignavibacteria bacterium]|nr:signal peptidase II [Ignavibacteria bacterium]